LGARNWQPIGKRTDFPGGSCGLDYGYGLSLSCCPKRHVATLCPDPDCTDFSDPRIFILILWGNFFLNHFGLGFLMGLGFSLGWGRMFYLCFYLSIFWG
jgi:hypothetical protein